MAFSFLEFPIDCSTVPRVPMSPGLPYLYPLSVVNQATICFVFKVCCRFKDLQLLKLITFIGVITEMYVEDLVEEAAR